MSRSEASTSYRRPPRIPSAADLPPLHERSALAIFDEGITFLRINPGLLLGITLLSLVPLRVASGLLPGSSLRSARPDQLIDALIGRFDTPGQVLAAFGLLVGDSFALFVVAAIYAKLAAAWFSGSAVSSSELFSWTIRRLPRLLILWLVVHIIEGVLAVFSVGVGGLVIGVILMLAAPVSGAEDGGVWASIKRSGRLMSSTFGRGVAVFVLVGVGGQLMRLILRALPTILSFDRLPIPPWVISGVTDLFATTISTSFTAAAAVVLYLDARVRREGIDLDMAMARSFPGAVSGTLAEGSDG